MRQKSKKKMIKYRKQTRKKVRRIKKNKKGGNNEKVNCCMCRKSVDIKDTLVPRSCLIKNGQNAHRICRECWWNPDNGFARENASHGCPGCIKNLPLTKVSYKQPEVFDFSLDDD